MKSWSVAFATIDQIDVVLRTIRAESAALAIEIACAQLPPLFPEPDIILACQESEGPCLLQKLLH